MTTNEGIVLGGAYLGSKTGGNEKKRASFRPMCDHISYPFLKLRRTFRNHSAPAFASVESFACGPVSLSSDL